MSKETNRYPVVRVIWRDAFSKDGWKSIEELLAADHATMDSVGYLVRKDNKYIGIANTVSREDAAHEDEACCTIFIPRPMVVSIQVLVKACALSKR